MNDLNFFSTLKKQKQKNGTLKIVGVIILIVLVVINGVFLAVGLLATNKLKASIKQNQTFLESADTKAKVRDANILTKEATVAAEYLSIMNKVSASFQNDNLIKVSLIDHVREMAPGTTRFEETKYEGSKVTLTCYTTNTADPMNYYHSLLQESQFSSVSMPGFNIDFNGTVKYSIILTLNGGGRK